MSEVMTCMPFEQLMNWVLEEKKTKGTVFGTSTELMQRKLTGS